MKMPIAPRSRAVTIVDDDASVRVSLCRLCEVCGLKATAYASAREFLDALERDRTCVECLILDTHMPDMNGIELQRCLIARGMKVPTIVFTADDAAAASALYASGDIVECLRKPVSAEALIEAIATALHLDAREIWE